MPSTRCCILMCWLGLCLAGCRSMVQSPLEVESRGELGKLDWLTGSWVRVSGSGKSEEHWTWPEGGTMLGVNRTVISGRTVAYEYLRIEQTQQGIVYLASPRGRHPPTAFALVENVARRAVFENPDYDFPRRIVYRRKGNRLDVRIEGEQDGQPMSEEWTWRRTAMDAMP